MELREQPLPCAKSTFQHGQWYNEEDVIDTDGLSFPPASTDGRSASQLFGFAQHVDQFLLRIIRNSYRLLFFLVWIQTLCQKTFDVVHKL
ncbi:hypothetical protein TNCV_3795551 [Trichonephila clavipes]|nr:hypothetical protein TNCV_3795551 [Trichonephila clavipes]